MWPSPSAFSFTPVAESRSRHELSGRRCPRPGLVHRNYRSPRSTQVIRYSDRLEVQNAGHSLVEDENFGKPGSLPRNPKLVSVFRYLGFAEGKGISRSW
jgi:hypothetical protein